MKHRELEVLAARDRLVVVGKTGTGKSTFVKRHLARELAHGRRVLFADYCDEYAAGSAPRGEVDEGPLRDRMTFEDFTKNPAALRAPDLSLAVVLDRDPREAAEQVSELVGMAEVEGNLLFGVDEVGMFSAFCEARLHYLAAQSRHWGVPVVLASQSMIDIPAKARRQATKLVTFRQTHPPDRAAIRELTDDEELAVRVSRLRKGECEIWRDEQPEEGGEE